jgi:hypothetical protein
VLRNSCPQSMMHCHGLAIMVARMDRKRTQWTVMDEHDRHEPHERHDHHDHEGHSHLAGAEPSGQLIFAIALIGVTFVAELVAGILSNSLALIADAGHMFVDIFALSISLLAVRLALRPATVGHWRNPVAPVTAASARRQAGAWCRSLATAPRPRPRWRGQFLSLGYEKTSKYRTCVRVKRKCYRPL